MIGQYTPGRDDYNPISDINAISIVFFNLLGIDQPDMVSNPGILIDDRIFDMAVFSDIEVGRKRGGGGISYDN
ncbi:MAG: hypothetical protein HYZ48_04745 [Chlamydiales bacterium]|nr:hypothetical protein [Chlamydiales bacterium]